MDMQGRGGTRAQGLGAAQVGRGRRRLKCLVLFLLAPVLFQASSSTPPTLVSVAGGGSQLGDGGPATQALLGTPVDVALDSSGNVYIADVTQARVRKISVDGTITTVAGNGSTTYSGDGGAATAAGMKPAAIAVDAGGSLYIADHAGSRIRKVAPNGIISTVAGTGTRGFSGDGGPGTVGMLYDPADVEVDAAGNVYIADFGNHRIRRLTPSGTITTVAGTGSDSYGGMGGPATQADVGYPMGLAVSPPGEIYVVNGFVVSRIDRDGVITMVAGNGMFSGDPAATSTMSDVRDVAVDGRGDVYISTSHTIQMVTPEGGMHHVAGTQDTRDGQRNTTYGFGGDGGVATQALLSGPSGIALDAAGNLLIADRYNARLRRLSPVPHPEPPPGIGAFQGQINRYSNFYKDMVSGDFNGDGRDDVAFSTAKDASNEQSSNVPSRVGIMLQTAAGKLAAPVYVDFPAVVRPPSVADFHGGGMAVVDMDGDRIVDILIAQGDGVGLIAGSRSGQFWRASFSGSLGVPTDRLLVMDVDRDGRKDVVARSLEAAGSGQAGVSIYFGSGAQALRRDFIALAFPFGSMASGDLNGDGVADLALGYTFAGTDDGGAALLVHDGARGFLPPAFYAAPGSGSTNLAVGDLDRDGRLDIAITRNRVRTNANVHILYQRFGGQFQPIPLATAPEPDNVVITDMDRDGFSDLIVLHVNNSSLGYFQQSPTRGLTIEARYFGGGAYNYSFNPIALGDVNGDGHLDVVLREGNTGVYVRTGTGRRVGLRVNGSQPLVPLGSGNSATVAWPQSGGVSTGLRSLLRTDAPTETVAHASGVMAQGARWLRAWQPQVQVQRLLRFVQAWNARATGLARRLLGEGRPADALMLPAPQASTSPSRAGAMAQSATIARPLRDGRAAICDRLR